MDSNTNRIRSQDSGTELLDHLPIGLIMYDATGHVLEVNQPFADLLGYSKEELLGLRADQIIHPEDLNERNRDTQALLTGSEINLTTERRLIHRTGKSVRTRSKKSTMERAGQPVVLVCVEDWTVEHDQLRDLIWAAYHDGLTGLINRTGLILYLEDLQKRQGSAAVALIDLNGFKQINDSHGHAGGDEYLRAVANRLSTAVGSSGVISVGRHTLVARLAGDEFVVVRAAEPTEPLGDETEVDPAELEQQIRDCLLEPITITGSAPLAVSASVGCVARQPWMGPEEVLDWADRLMYAEKERIRSSPHHQEAESLDLTQLRNRRWREHQRYSPPNG